jgi:hypothetical protein
VAGCLAGSAAGRLAYEATIALKKRKRK